MWFPEKLRKVAEVDIQPALDALAQLDENSWYADESTKKLLAGDRPTQSLFFYSLLKDQYQAIIQERPLTQEDVPRMEAYDLLYADFAYLFKEVEKYYPKGGVFLRAQIARMPPGGVIKEHRDNLLILENTHRIHIPLITTSKLRFMIDRERVFLHKGFMYELNNQLFHSVDNPKNSINRIHLIVDYLPPEYNVPASASDNFKFYIREHRSAHVTKPSGASLDLPKVIAIVDEQRSGNDYAFYSADFRNGEVKKVADWGGIVEDQAVSEGAATPYGILQLAGGFVVAAGNGLYFLDEEFKFLTKHSVKALGDARAVFFDGKYIYVISRAFNALLRFDLKKKKFDSCWQFFRDQQGGVSAKSISVDLRPDVDEDDDFKLNSVFVRGEKILVSGAGLSNLIAISGGKILVDQQIPLGSHGAISFAKGYAYLNPKLNQVAYMSDYDFRGIAADQLSKQVEDPPVFSGAIAKGKKGTLISGAFPASMVLLDMKNRSVAKSLSLPSGDGRILGVSAYE